MATDDENPEIEGVQLLTCLDDEGNEINIGAGRRGPCVSIIGPPDGRTAVLTDAQAVTYQEIVRAKLADAILPG